MPVGKDQSGQDQLQQFIRERFLKDDDSQEIEAGMLYIFSKLIAPKLTLVGSGATALQYQQTIRAFKKILKMYSNTGVIRIMQDEYLRRLVMDFFRSDRFQPFIEGDKTLNRKME